MVVLGFVEMMRRKLGSDMRDEILDHGLHRFVSLVRSFGVFLLQLVQLTD